MGHTDTYQYATHSTCSFCKYAIEKTMFNNKTTSFNKCSRCFSTSQSAYVKKFSKDHEWIDVTDGVGTVGITDHAQHLVGDLTYVELPEVDDDVDRDDRVGEVESSKATSEVFSPVSGVIKEVNEHLVDSPETINKDAEGEGWMFKIVLKDEGELDDLFDKDGYDQFVAESEE